MDDDLDTSYLLRIPNSGGALIDGNAARAVVLESTTDDLGAPRPRFPSARASPRSPPGLAWR